MKRPLSYLKAIVICHGKSEKQLCDFLKSNLRLKIFVDSDKKGEKSIQITSVIKRLKDKRFRNLDSFIKEFSDVEVCKNKTKKYLSKEFKIFIIMDTDECTEKQKMDFIDKSMFKNHWAYDHIIPIYNSPELETVLEKANIKFEKKGSARKKEYIKIFPTDMKYQTSEMIQIEEFCNNLKRVKDTNLDEFVQFCLDLSK